MMKVEGRSSRKLLIEEVVFQITDCPFALTDDLRRRTPLIKTAPLVWRLDPRRRRSNRYHILSLAETPKGEDEGGERMKREGEKGEEKMQNVTERGGGGGPR